MSPLPSHFARLRKAKAKLQLDAIIREDVMAVFTRRFLLIWDQFWYQWYDEKILMDRIKSQFRQIQNRRLLLFFTIKSLMNALYQTCEKLFRPKIAACYYFFLKLAPGLFNLLRCFH